MRLVRHTLNFCGWKDRNEVAKSLKRIYQATDDVEAVKTLGDFEAEWANKYPSIAPSLRLDWQVIAFPPSRAQNHLHYQRNREFEQRYPESHQITRQFSHG